MGIKFQCPKCKKELEAENDYAGMNLECPECKETVEVPKANLKAADSSQPEMSYQENQEDKPEQAKTNSTKKKDDELTPKQWIGGCLTLIILMAILGGCIKSCLSKDSAVESKDKKVEAQKKKTPEELRKEKILEQFSSWDGSHMKFNEYIKDKMNDPSSFEHIKTKCIDKKIICL